MKTSRRKCLIPCCHPFHCSTAGSSPSLPLIIMHPSLVYPDFFPTQSEAFAFCFIIHSCGWLSCHHVQEVQLTLVHPALVLIHYEARTGVIPWGGPIFLARATVPFLPEPSLSKSLKCRTPPNREKRRFPLKVLSREGCESGVSSYIRALPPWCRVTVRNDTLDTTSEINHETVAATITRTKRGHRLAVTGETRSDLWMPRLYIWSLQKVWKTPKKSIKKKMYIMHIFVSGEWYICTYTHIHILTGFFADYKIPFTKLWFCN